MNRDDTYFVICDSCEIEIGEEGNVTYWRLGLTNWEDGGTGGYENGFDFCASCLDKYGIISKFEKFKQGLDEEILQD